MNGTLHVYPEDIVKRDSDGNVIEVWSPGASGRQYMISTPLGIEWKRTGYMTEEA